jgi:amino acid permease
MLSWFAAFASAGMFVSITLAILDIGPHLMGGEKVTRSEWLHIAAPLVAVIGCLMASIAYGLAARKPWSRHLVLAIFGLIIVYASALGALNVLRHTIMWRAIVNASLFGCASAWYLYFKRNVAEYFANSEDDRLSHAGNIFPIALLGPECEMQKPDQIR